MDFFLQKHGYQTETVKKDWLRATDLNKKDLKLFSSDRKEEGVDLDQSLKTSTTQLQLHKVNFALSNSSNERQR